MITTEIPDLIKAYEAWLYDQSYQQSMEDLYSGDHDGNQINTNNAQLNKALRVMTGPTYELVMNVCTLINLFTVFLRQLMQSSNPNAIKGWMIA